MGVTTRNKPGEWQRIQFPVTTSGFVRSLFAHCSLIVRFKGEETAFLLDLYSDQIAYGLAKNDIDME
jgi:hypothetical protein